MESREVGRSTETLGGHSYWPGQKRGGGEKRRETKRFLCRYVSFLLLLLLTKPNVVA